MILTFTDDSILSFGHGYSILSVLDFPFLQKEVHCKGDRVVYVFEFLSWYDKL